MGQNASLKYFLTREQMHCHPSYSTQPRDAISKDNNKNPPTRMKPAVNEALPQLPLGHRALYTPTSHKTCTVTSGFVCISVMLLSLLLRCRRCTGLLLLRYQSDLHQAEHSSTQPGMAHTAFLLALYSSAGFTPDLLKSLSNSD